MSLFSNLFGRISKSDTALVKEVQSERGKYMPDVNTPEDERFTRNFISNGGRFLYALDMKEIQEHFDNILLENDWYENEVLCLENNLKNTFKGYNLQFGNNLESSFFFTSCESLVARDGSLLVCSKQLKELKMNDLPQDLVVFGTTSQIVSSISEGLRLIKDRNEGSIPTNITTIKNFEAKKVNDKDFMTYGSSAKNVYLLLLEDL